jgi:pyruvate dehydrogenase (quinone)
MIAVVFGAVRLWRRAFQVNPTRTSDMARAVAEIIVEVLRKAGVKRCYGIPGDTLNHFTLAIHNSDIRWVHVRHEEAGGFAAGAEGQLTGELTACAGSCGPGSLHFINGVYDAHRNEAPTILIASQIVRDQIGFDFPQEVDFKSIYETCSVFCDEIRTPEQAERKTVMAVQTAIAERGLAVLIVPADVAAAKVEEIGMQVHRSRPVIRPSDAELDKIARTINEGGNITIYGGAGCREAHDQVVALAERLKAPVARTSRAKDFLGHDNPYDVGMTGVLGMRSGYDAIRNCDTLILLGCGFAWSQFYPDDAKIIQIDLKARNLSRRHPTTIGAIGDIAATLDALLPRLEERTDRDFLDRMLELNEKSLEKQEKPAQTPKPGKLLHADLIHPQYMVETIARHAKPDAVWAADDGSAAVFALRHVPATGRNRTLASWVHGSMASGLSSALGAQATFPDRQVIVVAGDGGLAMLMGELLTLVQERLPIKIAVINNHSLGFVELEQKTEGLLPLYTDLQNPDFGKVAQAIGLWGGRVEKAQDLEVAVQEWIAQPGPALLDVTTARFELVMPPTIDAKSAFGMALYSTRAILGGQGANVLQMMEENFLP